MKYPIKKNLLICIPYKLENGRFKVCEINPDKSYGKITGHAEHHTFESCWICCRAHNIRIGYSDKKVLKIIKTLEDGKKEKQGEREKDKKNKGKKAKKGKEGKIKKGKDPKKGDKPKKSKKK